jgi:sulfur transfer complex TusBCD TusB component (DsrH family)
MNLSLKNAELTVDGRCVKGVLVLVSKNAYEKEDITEFCTDYIPDQLFVALNSDPVFYSNNYSEVDKMLHDYDNTVLSSDEDYISRSYLEKDSGLFVNFFQPSEHFDGDPVYVTVTTTPSFVRSDEDDEDDED